MKGRIHSFETFGTVDGPGIRFVVFVSGCEMRCKYCHNPDTWAKNGGTLYEAKEVAEKVKRYKNYYVDGGVTVSGGEPLLQIDFLTELFELLKAENVHTCIDTSGNPFDKNDEELVKKYDKLIGLTDLVLLDVKEINDGKHRELTGKSNKNTLDFLDYLENKGKDVWIRYVLVPGVTDDENDLKTLGNYLKDKTCVKRTDVLPYHTFGVEKYEKSGIAYKLKGVLPPSEQEMKKATEILGQGR